jgi:hypothetical protein
VSKKVAILQSNYIPWKGYFDIINSVDEFIIYDNVQYTKNDWRNRNRIKTSSGLHWLTIPVRQKGRLSLSLKINEIEAVDDTWRKKHWKSIAINYAKAKYFKNYSSIFENLYLNSDYTRLSDINFSFIKVICKILGINTKLSWSTDYDMREEIRTMRLVELCTLSGATDYLSGPSAKGYIDESAFKKANIKIVWMDYSNYPEYCQLFPPFQHSVSVIDLILNEGPNGTKYMKSF